MSRGIIYEYEDGGTYCGEWERDSSHGYGVGTGSGGRGRFEGLWERGGQVSGLYTWPNGMKYAGTWKENKRDGLGKETREDGTEYCGEFVRGARGPYGVSRLPNGVYKGSWRNGKQDGEGEETYLDGGCYRGQYKNGLRSGFGTRTSAAYEHRDKDALLHDQTGAARQRGISIANPFSSFKRLSEPSNDGSSGGMSEAGISERVNMQIYEGEWKDDKRHGYGVIKCLGSYTYYGQWSANSRTGYGVLISENGTKAEGQWQNGQLIVALKRKKLHIKSHQLETKVQTAHTQAIQAAGGARDKALLAESRASTAMSKAKMANSVVGTADKNAKLAREKAEQYKNATRISEVGLQSPVTDTEMSLSPVPPITRGRSSSARSTDSSGMRLDVEPLPHVPSYESLQYTPHESSDEGAEEDNFPTNPSYDSLAHERRRRFGARDSTGSRGSSSRDSRGTMDEDIMHSRRDEFAGSRGTMSQQVMRHTNSPSSARRRISDPNHGPQREKQRRVFSGNALRNSNLPLLHVEEEQEGEGVHEGGIVMGMPRRHRLVDSTTTDEDLPDSPAHTNMAAPLTSPPRGRSKGKPPPLLQRSSAVDILVNNLNQMANWNKMIAYVNFFLLLFLMVLILAVVIGMNYYRVLHFYHDHMPEDGSSAPILPSSQIA